MIDKFLNADDLAFANRPLFMSFIDKLENQLKLEKKFGNFMEDKLQEIKQSQDVKIVSKALKAMLSKLRPFNIKLTKQITKIDDKCIHKIDG